MKIKDIEQYVNDAILDDIYKEREDIIYERSEKEKEEISKIKERYPIDYEKVLSYINAIPPHFKNTRESILNALDSYLIRENLLIAYENEKFYKVGFCDGIRVIMENLK